MPKPSERFAAQRYVLVEANGEKFQFSYPRESLDPDGAHSKAVEEAVRQPEKLREYRARLVQDGRLTPAGVREKLREKAEELSGTDFVGRTDANLNRAHHYATQLRQSVAEARQGLTPGFKAPDPQDLRTAQKDAEMRAFLRGMEGPDRHMFLLHAVEEEREDVVRAALDHAPELSGLTAELQAQVRDEVIQARNADALAEIHQKEDAADWLERTVHEARRTLAAIVDEPMPGEGADAA